MILQLLIPKVGLPLTIQTLLCLFIYFLVPNTSNAQLASISGVVSDTTHKEPAIVQIELLGPTSINGLTDEAGQFLFHNLEAGIYQLKFYGLGYRTVEWSSIHLKAGEHLTFQVKIGSDTKTLKDVVVSSKRQMNSTNAVLEDIKKAGLVSTGISQEQIKMSQDRTAAQVMSRIPGITVVDGKFVMVRGLPERYNQVLMNNAIAPSTEVDRRTFSFDLIPSSVLDRMLIYKSGAPENTGDFAGGLIKVYTAQAERVNFTELTYNIGYRQGTTGHKLLQTKGSTTDFMGFDNGFRQLPNAFPNDNLRDLPNRSPKRAEAAQLLPNNWESEESSAMPDMGLGLTIARSFNWGSKHASTITALQYAQSYQSFSKSFNRYLELDNEANQVENRFAYKDQSYERDNRLGAISNWQLRLNANNRIEWKNLFNQIGEQTTVLRTGEDFIQFAGHQRKNYLYQYRSRTVYSGQLEGVHEMLLNRQAAQLSWVIGLNHLGENQPDLRRFRTIETSPGSSTYRMILPPSSNLYDAGRFYSQLKETGINQGLNVTLNLTKEPQSVDDDQTKAGPQLKLGYMLDYRTRQFDTRYFSYYYPGSSSLESLQRLEQLPLAYIFSAENIKVNDGFLLEEGTRASDNYQANNTLIAGYAGIIYPIGHLSVSGGLRAEYNHMTLLANNDAGEAIKVNSPVLSPLVFLNADYSFSNLSKWRMAYYRSVNRPEFRELAPFLFYDYQLDAEKYGNPQLTTAHIDNFDVRYEYYPRSGEMFSVGAFYKHFTNPIETQILIRSESPAFSYQNATYAYSSGLELEFRKSFKGITNNAILDNISINVNAAYILSKVFYNNHTIAGQETVRALQGQSPYILNAIVLYNDPIYRWRAALSYNVFGPRIFAVGSTLFPTIYEMPRHAFDLTISKQLTDKWTIKLGIQDLLNAEYNFYQDTNRDTKVDMNASDLPIIKYRRGSLCNLGISYKF